MIRSVFILCVVKLIFCIEHDFKGFDDSILFGIHWPGSPESIENLVTGEVNNISEPPKKEVVNVVTSNKEKYECHIPELRAKETARIEKYDGPSPLTFLNTLFDKKICAYRLESYWSYELCHGRYIKQYHEEREGKQIKTQEYYLGHWNSDKHAKLEADLKRSQELKSYRKVKVEGAILPSIEMVMDDGTVCDLSGKPRLTRVLYVCYIHGKHEVYSFKETSTCEYEIIILSPFLCEHPHFKPKDDSENIIDCVPVGDSPKKPRSLLKMEADSLKFQHMKSIKMISAENNPKDILAVLKVEKIDKDGETHLKFEIHPLMDDEDMMQGSKSTQSTSHALINTDDSPVRAFLNGENCLHGGTGWWKYEFCYGKHVVQYHVDRAGEKTTLLLGKFDEEEHINWIKENKGKAPKPVEQRTSVSHFYSNGDVCDKTGKPRQTEVKLKCLENSSSPAQVSLYLLEPRTCHYILGVETPLICDILPLADDNGLIKSAKPVLLKLTSTEGNTADQVKVEEEIPEQFGND